MKTNMGSMDKTIRILLGAFLVSMFFWVDSSLKYFGILGLVFLVTSFVGFCPFYSLFGINTCKKKS